MSDIGDLKIEALSEDARPKTRKLVLRDVEIGGGAPVSVQSMTKCPTTDVDAVIAKTRELQAAGCQIIRVAVPDEAAAEAVGDITKRSPIPVVADIHLDHKLALTVIEGGVDCVRINPGNMKRDQHLKAVADAAKSAGIPIRIGINSGSLEQSLLRMYGGPTPQAMVQSAILCINKFESWGFRDLKLSMKSHDVTDTVDAYLTISQITSYPLHLGITASGSGRTAIIKSAIGIGSLLLQGIGDTIRVSLADDPLAEVEVAIEILRVLGLRSRGVEFVACPTCGRCKVNLLAHLETVKSKLSDLEADITIAVMGCVVNGPGEARQADIGIAFADDGTANLFRKGKRYASGAAEIAINRLIWDVKQTVRDV